MISQKWSKLIRSLQQKKYRKTEGLFVVEGEKAVLEVLASSWQVQALFATDDFLQRHAMAAQAAAMQQRASADELAAVGSFQTNDAALAVVSLPEWRVLTAAPAGWSLMLDQINDPGNLGTLIRIADWYGISHIICSPDTVDAFNPKVIASAKGSFLRVQLHYQPLLPWLSKQQVPVLGAYLGGDNLHHLAQVPAQGILVLGNEAKGISAELSAFIQQKITIPAFGGAESLNVGIAGAVILDNIRRLSPM